ncbi:MAG: bifunctional [glutamate--ammonia ligase]-adenylyl-L-tyrosine phosphorylase/[glutamate--ammonia-ligase] adenylyltransferase, partial [Gammaproteobacteria bacterium]
SAQFGTPLDENGRPQQLLVLGMGKLGGYELNFSSDIDLIFAYPQDGQTQGGRSLSIHEFFVRLAQKLIRALNEITADGFVFRVDARLRPFGDSGPLVMSFAALEQYYQSQGRDWERYAMVKARAIAGDAADIADLDQLLRPFIYRRYLDYSAIASIREMKDMIEAEVRRKGIADNVKLGRGGIREIEFIGQTYQLIRGGRDTALQIRSILHVLRVLVELKCLDADEAARLDQSYRFLRRLENRIQMLRDQQTHVVPKSDTDRARLAFAMGLPDWPALDAELNAMRAQVSEIFRSIVSETADTPKPQAALQSFWRNTEEDAGLQRWLAELGYAEAADIARQMARFSRHAQVSQLSEAASGRLQKLLASLLAEIVAYPAPAVLLERMLDLLRAIVGRAVYVNLLLEYAVAREQMLKLCAASEWFARQLTGNPLLLDELLDAGELYQVADRAGIAQELDYVMSVVPKADLEQHMDRLRQFRNAHLLRTAAQDIGGMIDVMGVGDVLSFVAEVILERTLQLAWNEMVLRYGEPQCSVDGEIRTPGMGIVGYGKLGGYELGYSSDLDIVFLHNSRGENEYTTGTKPIDNSNFFARVAQRALHILGTRTYAGMLYETDTRLRPDGRAGLMVSS